MQKADPLIRTKLRLPAIRAELVARPRLLERVAQGLRGPLTLITAPAGFGKTTLAASGVADCGMPVAWLSLDKDDNQARRFLRYLVAALQGLDPQIGSDAAQMLVGMQPPAPEAVLTSLINDLDAAGRKVALVLDDYQFISSQAIHDAITFLLDHPPDSFHLIIVTRSDPPLPLARLRARGQTVELRTADLRFTVEEAGQFLNDLMGLRLDAGSLAALDERTEGWIAGLQMAALSMRGREDVESFIQAFAGTHRFIMDFMLEEVLGREPEAVQDFLLQTSIVTRLSGPLCEAVTGAGGGQAMLESLERRNLFVVPLDDERRWYRYHHLFADLLQARLDAAGPEQRQRLLRRAANWCAQEGQMGEAIGYALAAEEYGLAAGLMESHWGTEASSGEIETVWSWLAALPEETVRNSARLSLACCWVLWLRGQTGAVETHLVDAERALEALIGSGKFDPEDEAHSLLPAQVTALRSFVARYHQEYQTASELAERALRLIPENLPPQTHALLYSLIYMTLGSAYDGVGDMERAIEAYAESIRLSRLFASLSGIAITYRLSGALRLMGRLRAAEAACREALEYAQAQRLARLPAAGILHVALSEVLVERNELEAAEAHLSQGFELGQGSGRLDAARNAAPVLARLRLMRQDPNGALAAVQEAEMATGQPIPPLAQSELLALRARILIQQGALEEAARCAEQAVRLASQDQGQTGATAALAATRVQVARSEPAEAAALLEQAIAAAERDGRNGAALELRILRSLALRRQNRPVAAGAAEAELERALALAEPEGYVRLFLDEGPPMQQLIAQWLAHAGEGRLREYASHLLAQFNTELNLAAPAQEASLSGGEPGETLTPRELEVLRLLAGGLSNRQIAEELVLSEGTVKFYVHNIMEKLGVHSRTQALLIARERKLV